MILRHPLRTCAVLASVLLAVASQAAAAPKNVLFICVDDLKPLTHSYGDPFVKTPNMDRLAARGVQFDRAYCNQSVCGPSRFNLMFSTRSTTSGIYGFGREYRSLYPEAVALPQHLRSHGYSTASVGKVYHVGHGNVDDTASWSEPTFKDRVIEYLLPESTEGGKLTREEALFNNVRSVVPVREMVRGAAWEKIDVPDNAYADGRVATEAGRRLAEYQRTGQTFFLAVGFARPHLPFTVPKKYWDLYDPAKLPLAANPNPPKDTPAYALKRLLEMNQYAGVPERPPLDEKLQRTLIHGYYAAVSYTDAQIGRVLDGLDETGLAKSTIVILWGDNGFSFGTHGDWTKHSNYEEAVRIPLIMAGPGIAAGARSGAMIETIDIYPTLTALLGVPTPTGPQPFEGASQLAVLRDPSATVKDHVYHAFPRGRPGMGDWIGRAIRTPRYRMVEWKPVGPSKAPAEYELYDYQQDPNETQNLAARQPETLAQLKAVLAKYPEARAPQRAPAH